MGTSYDIRCLDCNENAHVSASYDPIRIHEIRALIQYAAPLAALAPVFTDGGDWQLKNVGVTVPVQWLAQHAGHRLRPISEYGEIDGACGKRVQCTTCAADQGYCGKETGHEGACERAKRPWG